MTAIDKVCNLLEKQKEYLMAYEAATHAMLDCGPDDMEKYITERGRLANLVDGLRDEMETVCGADPNGAVLYKTAEGKQDFERTPGEYHCVFYAAQGIQSVVSRVKVTDSQVAERLHGLRDEALDKIKQQQNVPKIKKYLTDLTDQGKGMSFTDEKA